MKRFIQKLDPFSNKVGHARTMHACCRPADYHAIT